VDAASEVDIHAALKEFVRDRTTFLITHKLHTVPEIADRVVMMDAGRVLDIGTHPELLARCDGYRRLFESSQSWRQDGPVAEVKDEPKPAPSPQPKPTPVATTTAPTTPAPAADKAGSGPLPLTGGDQGGASPLPSRSDGAGAAVPESGAEVATPPTVPLPVPDPKAAPTPKRDAA
jgi:hypothetical protein